MGEIIYRVKWDNWQHRWLVMDDEGRILAEASTPQEAIALLPEECRG